MKTFITFFVWMSTLFFKFLPNNCEINVGSGPIVLSAQCIKEYALTHNFHFGYPMTAKTLMCRCDCSDHEAGLWFHAANENHRIECSDHLRDIKGFCLEKKHEIRTDLYCPSEKHVFTFCNIKFTAKRTYEFKNWYIQNVTYNIAMPSGETIIVPANKEYISINDTKYTVFTKGPPCDFSNSHLRFYNNIDDDEETIHTCDSNQILDQFITTDRFIISNNIKYHSQLWHRVNYTEEVCKGQYPSFKFKCQSDDMNCFLDSCKRIWQKMEFNYINKTQMQVTQDIKLILMEINSNAKTTATPTTTSTFSVMQRLFVNPPNITSDAMRSQVSDGNGEKHITTICQNCDFNLHTTLLMWAVIVIGILGPLISTLIILHLYHKFQSHFNGPIPDTSWTALNNSTYKQNQTTKRERTRSCEDTHFHATTLPNESSQHNHNLLSQDFVEM